MTLRQKQSLFVFLIARLILFANENKLELTFGEAYRSPEEAKRQSKLGKGIENSLHIKRLAVDLNLFKDGKYLSSTESHRILGEWWERQHPLCRWGGRWNDGNHYEVNEYYWRE
jgi:hypothetical protein